MDQTENHLIEQFPRGLQKRFLQACERFPLVPSTELGSRGDVLAHAYFPDSGVIVLTIDIEGRPPLEVGAVGKESMLGSELLLGPVLAPWRAVVQGAGTCWRIDARSLREAMEDMPALKASLQRNFIVQVLQRQALASANLVPRPRDNQRQAPRYAEQSRAAAA